MASGAVSVDYDDYFDFAPDFLERMDRDSDRITADYNNSAALEYDYLYEQPELKPDGLSESEKQYAKDSRRLYLHYTVCAMAIVAAFCLCMFMMVRGVSAKDQMDKYVSTLSSLQHETVRLETDIQGRCELGAVAAYAADAGLHKVSQFQTVYVGGGNENSGIITNAVQEKDDSGQLWEKLKSFFD